MCATHTLHLFFYKKEYQVSSRIQSNIKGLCRVQINMFRPFLLLLSLWCFFRASSSEQLLFCDCWEECLHDPPFGLQAEYLEFYRASSSRLKNETYEQTKLELKGSRNQFLYSSWCIHSVQPVLSMTSMARCFSWTRHLRLEGMSTRQRWLPSLHSPCL